MDSEITEILEDFGLDTLDYENIYNVSLKSVVLYYKDSMKDYLSGCVSVLSEIAALMILGSVISAITEEDKYKYIISILLMPAVTVILTEEIYLCITSAVSLLNLNGKFMLAFVPAYAIAISVSGNPSVALTYNSAVMGFAELISFVIDKGFIELIGCFFCLCFGFSVNKNINFTRFVGSVNRAVTLVLGITSTVFTSLLSVKGLFSSSADSVISKGVKYAIGSLIPVIGSSISDAYATLLGSVSIIRSSVALIGISAVILINFPVVIEIVMFNITLNILGFIGDILDCNKVSELVRGFAVGVKIIGLLVVFEAFILIISTAVVLSVRGA
ncbi:MAG: hypothetical protein IKV21_05775 [Clostridia bacterium]|nr:hypothetical protein [Clostridia bacterium]